MDGISTYRLPPCIRELSNDSQQHVSKTPIRGTSPITSDVSRNVSLTNEFARTFLRRCPFDEIFLGTLKR